MPLQAEFLTLLEASLHMSQLTAVQWSVGQLTRLAEMGTINICFAHVGEIGLFAGKPNASNGRLSTVGAYQRPLKTVWFRGYLQSMSPPKRTELNRQSNLAISAFGVIPVVLINTNPPLTIEELTVNNHFWGLIREQEFVKEHDLGEKTLTRLDKHIISDDWLVRSDELDRIYQFSLGRSINTKTSTAAAPKLTVDWKAAAKQRAYEIIKRQRAIGCYPSQIAIADEIAIEFRKSEVFGVDGKPLTGSYIKRHALLGISSAQLKQLSTKTS